MTDPQDPVSRLPHAAPFLLLDRTVSVDVEHRRGVFAKLVAASDPCLAADGTLPAAFVLEALAQGGGTLVAIVGGVPAAYLAAVDDFRMHGEVRAGDTLTIEVQYVRRFGGAVHIEGRALVEGSVRAEGRLTLAPPR
jgi:3-hydroxymyristoyl/3-hydroxydecanoyl-(acyl carrier protein) dehydratase